MKRILSLIALCLLAPAVFAAPNFFTPSPNDQSMYYLATIFGNVGNVLTQWSGGKESTLLKFAFLYFNNAVIVLGCILILYSLVVSTINTSHQGEMLGSKWNSVWIPLRSAMGFALLLPTTTSSLGMKDMAVQGYAVIQVFVMWVIVQGVGAADYIWNNMVDQVASGNAKIVVNSASTSDVETATSIFQYLTCSIAFTEAQNLRYYWTQEYNNNGNVSATIDTTTKKKKNNYAQIYLQTTPYILYQDTDQVTSANLPNTYVWAFGVASPNDWSRSSICGYVTMPTGSGPSGDVPLQNYYTSQRDLINNMIGYDLRNNNTAYGIYGGNWYGIYPSTGQNPQSDPKTQSAYGGPNGSHAFKTTITTQNADGTTTTTTTVLPTLAFLADSYLVYEDTGAVPVAPGGTQNVANTGADSGPSSCTITYDPDGNEIPCTEATPSSDASSWITDQLQQVAMQYQAATLQNYQTYQAAEAALQAQANQGTNPGNPDSNGTILAQCNPDDPSTPCAGKKETLVAAAKYNGWASAGVFFLNMAQMLNTSTTTFSAYAYDYSYPALACQDGIGITSSTEDPNGTRRCQDARTSADINGGAHQGHKNKYHAYGRSTGNSLGKVLIGAEGITMQALSNTDSYSSSDNNSGNGGGSTSNCTPLTDSNGNVILDSSGKPVQSCGIYSGTSNLGAANPNNFGKPKFPKMIINPLNWYKYVNGMIMYNFSQAMAPLSTFGTGGQLVNPLFLLRSSGLRLLGETSKLYHMGFVYMWKAGLVSFVFSNISGIASAMMTAMTWGMAMYSALLGIMMTMGALMAYYFPMIPYLVFTFAFIQWLVLTIEAMAAAPMLSLGILNPEGTHEAFGQSSAGVGILASVFLRPSLMIIGFFAATVMSYVTVLIVNGGFFMVAGLLVNGGGVTYHNGPQITGIGIIRNGWQGWKGGTTTNGDTSGMFSLLILWGIYVNTLMVVLNKSFSLIYHIPDHIMRWIGIAEERTEIEGMMSQVKGGVEKGAETGHAAAEKQMDARRKSMESYAAAGNEIKKGISGGGEGG